MKSKVMKSLSDEEKTILANIKSLVAQLESMEAAESGDGMETAPVLEADQKETPGEEPEETSEDEKVMQAKKAAMKKSVTQKSDEGTTASDDAEERPEDDEPQEGKDALALAAKALLALSQPKGVAKSQRSTTPEMRAIADLTNAVGRIAKGQEVLGEAVVGILQGMGITDQVIKAATPAAPVQKPVASSADAAAVLKSMLEGAGLKLDSVQKTDVPYGREAIGDVLKSLVG